MACSYGYKLIFNMLFFGYCEKSLQLTSYNPGLETRKASIFTLQQRYPRCQFVHMPFTRRSTSDIPGKKSKREEALYLFNFQCPARSIIFIVIPAISMFNCACLYIIKYQTTITICFIRIKDHHYTRTISRSVDAQFTNCLCGCWAIFHMNMKLTVY